jgi:hypothetical protein
MLVAIASGQAERKNLASQRQRLTAGSVPVMIENEMNAYPSVAAGTARPVPGGCNRCARTCV